MYNSEKNIIHSFNFYLLAQMLISSVDVFAHAK